MRYAHRKFPFSMNKMTSTHRMTRVQSRGAPKLYEIRDASSGDSPKDVHGKAASR